MAMDKRARQTNRDTSCAPDGYTTSNAEQATSTSNNNSNRGRCHGNRLGTAVQPRTATSRTLKKHRLPRAAEASL